MKFETWKKLNEEDKIKNYDKLSSHDKYLVRLSSTIYGKIGEKTSITNEDKESLAKLKNYANNLFNGS